jgi:hypothetical protein
MLSVLYCDAISFGAGLFVVGFFSHLGLFLFLGILFSVAFVFVLVGSFLGGGEFFLHYAVLFRLLRFFFLSLYVCFIGGAVFFLVELFIGFVDDSFCRFFHEYGVVLSCVDDGFELGFLDGPFVFFFEAFCDAAVVVLAVETLEFGHLFLVAFAVFGGAQ